ncbi:PaaI family thioesterase [Massilia sp. NR 4-1]|uniref:PaaI family thioesterase n=1 Tax=Massilia sp. NR 4-1 TaxID=1678028 RepID=UPI0009E4BEC7|nr:PaaI family thioesterase [Massilia sp. NR 4-1]
MTTLLASLPDLNRVLEGARFLAGYDFKVTACAPGECELRVPFKPELERPGGIVSGMTIMGAADVAMWLAIMTLRGMEEHWVTSDMKTAFLRAGIGEPLLCKARVLRMGRRSAYGSVETFGQAGSLLAHHVVSYARASEPASRAAPPGAPQ